MKYEYFNTFIAAMGLGLAAFSTYMQFKTEKDELSLEVLSGAVSDKSFTIESNYFLPKNIFGENKKLAGPYPIQLEITNNMNRPVTVKGVKIEYLSNGMQPVEYSNLINKNGPSELFATNPFLFQPHTVKRTILNINIPVFLDESKDKCYNPSLSYSDKPTDYSIVRDCYYAQGTDFMGNDVRIRKFDGGGVIYEKNEKYYLYYKITIVTGDNTYISKVASLRG